MITNSWLRGDEDLSEVLELRSGIVPECSPESDAIDRASTHLVVYADDIPVAAGSIFHDGTSFCIRKCGVAAPYLKQGYGDLLVKLLLLRIFSCGVSMARAYVDESSEGFFERYGFMRIKDGDQDDSAGSVEMRVDKDTLVFPSKCGDEKHFNDIFGEGEAK